MTVICPNCKSENQLPDVLDRKTAYKCKVCEKRFVNISNKNFKEIAFLMLVAWIVIPVMIWIAVILLPESSEHSIEQTLGIFLLMSSVALAILSIAFTAIFLEDGFRHRRFTGVAPRGFRRFIMTTVLSVCISVPVSLLAPAWWNWWL